MSRYFWLYIAVTVTIACVLIPLMAIDYRHLEVLWLVLELVLMTANFAVYVIIGHRHRKH